MPVSGHRSPVMIMLNENGRVFAFDFANTYLRSTRRRPRLSFVADEGPRVSQD